MKKVGLLFFVIFLIFFAFKILTPQEDTMVKNTKTMEHFLRDRGIVVSAIKEKVGTVYRTVLIHHGPPPDKWRNRCSENTALWVTGRPGDEVSFLFKDPVTNCQFAIKN